MLQRELLKTSTTEFKKVSFSTNGNGDSGNGQRSYHYHPRFRGGARLAALRAFSGAMKVLKEGMSPVMAADLPLPLRLALAFWMAANVIPPRESWSRSWPSIALIRLK